MIQYSSINDAWGNKEIYKKNSLNNFNGFNNSKPEDKIVSQKNTPIEKPIDKPIIITNVPQNVPQTIVQNIAPNNIINKEHFEPVTSTINSTCNFAEHFKNCEHCRNSLSEHFNNDSSMSTIFGINISKDILRIIFIILVVLIFIIILSTINISLNNPQMNMKYYMVPQIPHNLPYYH